MVRIHRRWPDMVQGRCVWESHIKRVASVVTYIQQQGLRDIILVGHSFAGSVIQKVTEDVPDPIERTVFLDALVVEDNHCVFDNLQPITWPCSTHWRRQVRTIQC